MAPYFGTRHDLHEKMNGKKVYGKEDCPFCKENEGSEYFVWGGKYWKILYNKFPYSGDHQHLMAVPIAHKQFSHELSQEELLELPLVYNFMREYFGEDQYFSFTRESMANRSVEHLHMHFLVGKLQGRFLRKMLELQGYPITEELQF